MQTTPAPSLDNGPSADGNAGAVEARARGTLSMLSRSLWRLLSGGHAGLGYIVQGAPSITGIREDGKRGPVMMDPGDDGKSWRPARELVKGPDGKDQIVPRRFTPATVEAHLRGRYSAGPEAAGWVEWVAVDIDAHASEGEPAAAATARARGVLAQVLGALGCGGERWPLMQRSPGGGFHVWLPLTREGATDDHRWPAAFSSSWVRHHLAACGVELRDGVCEVYPAGRRLRAPCGRGSVLLRAVAGATAADVIDPLKLEEWPGTTGRRMRWVDGRGDVVGEAMTVRRVGPMVGAFLGEWQRQRRTLADWLGRPEAAWDPVWGFLDPGGAAKKNDAANPDSYVLTQQIDDAPGPLGRARSGPALRVVRGGLVTTAKSGPDRISPSTFSNSPAVDAAPTTNDPEASRPSMLVKGPAFWRKVSRYLTDGVTDPGTRHDAVMVLTFAWAAAGGLDEEATIGRFLDWCGAHAHQGSRLAGSPQFTRECIREARGYLKGYMHRWPFRGGRGRRGDGAAVGVLTAADRRIVELVDAGVRTEASIILAFMAGRAGRDGVASEPVEWCASLARRLLGDRRVIVDGARRRAGVVAFEELARLGVVTRHTGHSVGHHGRLWSCWYRFGSGELAQPVTICRATWEAAGRRERLVPSLAMVAAGGPQDAPGAAFVDLRQVAARQVREGVLVALSDGSGEVRVILEPGPWMAGPAVPGYRPAWWVRQFRGARPPTVGAFFHAHEGRIVLGSRWGADDLVSRRLRAGAAAPALAAGSYDPPRAELAAELPRAAQGEGGAVELYAAPREVAPALGELPAELVAALGDIAPDLAGAMGEGWAAWSRRQKKDPGRGPLGSA